MRLSVAMSPQESQDINSEQQNEISAIREIFINESKESKKFSKFEDFLLYEYREAWNHYRHLEKIRDSYINYFFTIAIGYIGFLGLVLNDISQKIDSKHCADSKHFANILIELVSSETELIILYTPSFLVFLILASFLVNIIRSGFLLAFYSNLFSNKIRFIIYGDNFEKINQVFWVRNDQHFLKVSNAIKGLLPRTYGIQNLTEFYYSSLLVFIYISQFYLFILSLVLVPVRMIISFVILLMLVIESYILFSWFHVIQQVKDINYVKQQSKNSL
jgi:hypothetical protein